MGLWQGIVHLVQIARPGRNPVHRIDNREEEGRRPDLPSNNATNIPAPSPSHLHLARLSKCPHSLERLIHDVSLNFELIDLDAGEGV